MEDKIPAGRIFNIQRFCTSDGPGIRTTVFFQGCPLHCPWCHNPESRPFKPSVSFQPERCIGCGLCKRTGAGTFCRRAPGENCSGCGHCTEECPGGALTLLGRPVTVREIMNTVLRDIDFYRETGGGMTLSGGEPLAQCDFAASLLRAAKKHGLHTAVETSGAVPLENIRKILETCDLFLFDIKASPGRYEALTGTDWSKVSANLDELSRSGSAIRLRVPLIQEKNMEDELLNLLKQLSVLPGVEGIDLLPYHNMGRGKAEAAGLTEPDWTAMSAPTPELQKKWEKELRFR